MEKPIIALYGAFDRFNFGDILFLTVARHYAPEVIIEKGDWRPYGLVDSDLRDRGGFKNFAISHLIHDKPMAPGSMLIVPGGEVLTASITSLYRCLFTDFHEPDRTFASLIRSRLGKKEDLTKRAMNRLGVPWKYPFVPMENQIPGNPLTAFLGVGGRTLSQFSPDNQQQICSALSSAKYLSVRDPLTHKALIESGLSECELVPDPVQAIRRIYTVNEVCSLASQATQLIINSYQESGYFCFQSALRHLNGNSEIVAERLDKIAEETGLIPVLVSAGTALLHEDHLGLYAVSIKMKQPHVLITMPSVMDIASLIACSRLVISTSLHAMILAISYEVPRLVLSGLEAKTANYVKHWDPVNFVNGVDYSNVVESALVALQSEPDWRHNLAESMASKAEGFIKEMWERMLRLARSRTSSFD